MSYVDAVLDSNADRIYVVERTPEGKRAYKEFPTNYVLYYEDPKGKHRSIYGDPVSRFSTRKKAEFEKEQDHYKQTTDGSWLKQREEEVTAQIEAAYLQRRDALMDLMLAWMGDIARQQVGAEHLDLSQYREATAQLAQRWSPEDTAKRIRYLRQLDQHLHTNVNEGLALEVAFIQAFGR